MASSKITKATEGVLSRVTDFTLFLIFYGIESAGAKRLGQLGYASGQAGNLLADINYKSIKRSLFELQRKGLINTIQTNLKEIDITASGRKRLDSILPQYQKKRPWDKKIYLVTYDIPVTHNRARDAFREFLKKIGCGLLQESIWVTPYNPTRLVREFVEERKLEGTVLVSVLGKDGSIGGMSLNELIEAVYKLSELNDRYDVFLYECKSREKSKAELAISYMSVLEDDPQLPFELLPDWWLGDEAYKEFSKILKA